MRISKLTIIASQAILLMCEVGVYQWLRVVACTSGIDFISKPVSLELTEECFDSFSASPVRLCQRTPILLIQSIRNFKSEIHQRCFVGFKH